MTVYSAAAAVLAIIASLAMLSRLSTMPGRGEPLWRQLFALGELAFYMAAFAALVCLACAFAIPC